MRFSAFLCYPQGEKKKQKALFLKEIKQTVVPALCFFINQSQQKLISALHSPPFQR